MNYQNITKDDMLNGDGLRVVLWVSGCEHHCPECQNPVTWNPNDGLLFGREAIQEIEAELKKDYVSGITFSGGDPLHPANRFYVLDFARVIKEYYPNKTIWMYTGYTWEQIKDIPMIEYVDVLVDGRYVKELRDTKLHWKGSSNQRVIDVKKSFETGKVVLWDNDGNQEPVEEFTGCGCGF